MADPTVQTLMAAVRRRLWRSQGLLALRQALWASAALVALASAVHLVVHPVPAGALALALVGPALLLARAAWRRPADAACALWADRHLGGASAFSTLLDLQHGPATGTDLRARHRLERWATQQVPAAQARLAGQALPLQLARPLLALMVCGSLAAFILNQMDPAPATAVAAGAAAAASAPDTTAAVAQALEPATLADQVAQALQATPPARPPAERRDGGRAAAGATDPAEDQASAAAPAPAAASATALRPADASAGPAVPVDSPPQAGAGATAGTGGGREAGDSRDPRSGAAVSQALHGTMPPPRWVARSLPTAAAQRADLGRAAEHDNALLNPAAAAAPAQLPPPAATPPTALANPGLSPTESTYVQAWMKANPGRR